MQIWLPPQKIFCFRLHLPTTDDFAILPNG
jgi:hypothetical protein